MKLKSYSVLKALAFKTISEDKILYFEATFFQLEMALTTSSFISKALFSVIK